jgi:hypothetical protein
MGPGVTFCSAVVVFASGWAFVGTDWAFIMLRAEGRAFVLVVSYFFSRASRENTSAPFLTAKNQRQVPVKARVTLRAAQSRENTLILGFSP